MLIGGREYKRVTDELYTVSQSMKRVQQRLRVDYIYYHGDKLNLESMSLQELQDLQTSLAGFRIPESGIYYTLETNLGSLFIKRATDEFREVANTVATEVGCGQLSASLPNIATLFNLSVYGKDDTMLDVMCKAVVTLVSGGQDLPYGYCNRVSYPYISSVLEVYGDIIRFMRFRDKDILADATFNKLNLALTMEMNARNTFIRYLWEHKYDNAYKLISNRAIMV